jgi:ABC-2 type transport system permease protein
MPHQAYDKDMYAALRYCRLWFALARFGLVRELAFRANFLVKITVELLWFAILIIFWDIVFAQTNVVAGWSKQQYMFFVGCFFALEGTLETFFLGNCGEFADMIRSGDLDFVLIKPIDEQFLVSCRNVDWTTVPNIIAGTSVMVHSLVALEWSFDPLRLILFVVLFACSVGLAYSFMLTLTATSVWMVRNQSLFELWWLFTTLVRYPREIFAGTWAAPVGFAFTYVIPVMLIINVPASVMVRGLDLALNWPVVLGTVVATGVVLLVSRWFFRLALRRYRSASS